MESAKIKRKGLTKDEIKKQGLNIYPKSGVAVGDLILSLLAVENIESNRRQCIRLTPSGKQHLFNLYTDYNCDSFQTYLTNVHELTCKRNETNFALSHIASMYYRGWSEEKIEELYFSDQDSTNATQKYHEHVIDQFDLVSKEDDVMLHVVPRLYLRENVNLKEIRLNVEGISLGPHPIIFERPYPNKRYIVAGVKLGGETFTSGFYPIIDSQDSHGVYRLAFSFGFHSLIVFILYLNPLRREKAS